MSSNFRTYGTELVFNIPEMGAIQFGNPVSLYGHPVVHEKFTTWRCNYCNAVNDIDNHNCRMCAADIPKGYEK